MVEEQEQPVAQQASVEDSTKMMSTLMHIQELFYRLSSHKDGPQAGKVNKDQFKESKYSNLIVSHQCSIVMATSK